MKTRIIHTKIWDDNWFIKLSRASKILFLYVLTNPSLGMTGIYELPDGKISYQTGITSAEIEACKAELSPKIIFALGWVKIANIERYQNFSGPKNEIAMKRELELIPQDVIDTLSIGYQYPMDSLNNHKSVIINNKSIINNQLNIKEILSDDDFIEISETYNVPLSFVLSKWDDLQNWCKSKGKKYKDYNAALRNWVKRDAIERIHNAKTGEKRISLDLRSVKGVRR